MTSSNREGIIMLGRVLLALLLAFGGVGFLPQSQVQAGTPSDNYTIERYFNEYPSQQQTDSTTFVDAVTLTFTPPTSKDYLVIVSALTNNDSTSYPTVTQLVEDTTTYSETYHQPVDASLNWRSFGAHKVFSLTASTSYTFKIQYRTELGDGTATAYIKRVAISVMEVANYYNAEQEAEISTTSTSYVDAVTLGPFTPTAGDYLILVTANLKSGTSGKAAYAQWLTDGTLETEIVQTGTTYMSWGAVEQDNLTAAPHTFTMQYHSSSPATAFIKSARITAVLLADMGSGQYVESEAESSTTSITYVDKATLSFTPSTRADYLEIVSGLGRQENSSYAFFANLDVDGTSEGEYVFVPGADKIYRSFMMAGKHNKPGGQSHVMKVQWRTNNSATNSEAFIKDVHMIDIKIDTAESYNDSPHTTVDNNFGAGEEMVYIWAHGLKASSDNYSIAYYDGSATGGGQKVATDNGLLSTAYGNLSSYYNFPSNPNVTLGTWHAVVFDTEFGSPPTNYNDAFTNAGYVVEDSFEVTAGAIPEFTTVLAAIAVAGLCFGIYYCMRKRYQRQAAMA